MNEYNYGNLEGQEFDSEGDPRGPVGCVGNAGYPGPRGTSGTDGRAGFLHGPVGHVGNTGITGPKGWPSGYVPSENEIAALKLRLMMHGAKEEDKCTLCKAAEALEKADAKARNDTSWAFPMLMLLPFLGGGADINPDTMKACLDAMSKSKKSEEPEKSSEV